MKIYCNQCKKLIDGVLSLKFQKVKPELFVSPTDKRNPKYNFMVKSNCSECGGYIKFLPHTEEVIKYLEAKYTV
jgi:hypothetical protein